MFENILDGKIKGKIAKNILDYLAETDDDIELNLDGLELKVHNLDIEIFGDLHFKVKRTDKDAE